MGATQTISNNQIIKFDSSTKRTTGNDGVSYNSTTGVLSLDSTKRYWVQASVAIKRSSNSDYAVRWFTSSGGNLDQDDGSFFVVARRVRHINSSGTPFVTSSHMASLVVDYPSVGYRLETSTIPSSSTVTLQTNLFIIELS
tara:strand:- start:933 stop:1355 length:423 start_codon:yes stop_codon:yes gene_type:complete